MDSQSTFKSYVSDLAKRANDLAESYSDGRIIKRDAFNQLTDLTVELATLADHMSNNAVFENEEAE